MNKKNHKRLTRLSAALLLACALLVLTACAPHRSVTLVEATLVPGANTLLPEAVDDSALRQSAAATLWFRYREEPLLAPETRTVTRLPSQSYETALITELLSGPAARSSELTGLFPAGTRVLSTVTQGRTLFVTLSAEALNPLPDEPVDWQEDDAWRVEAPLRRRLTMQSLVATLTENCEIDTVQVLISGGDNTLGSLRLRQNYFLDDSEDSVLTQPMARDESLLLTGPVTLRTVFACWQRRDWARLYLYLASGDAATGLGRPVYQDFVTTMEALPQVIAFTLSDGFVRQGGDSATFTADVQLRAAAGETRRNGAILRLKRESGLWKITQSQLTGWLEVE